MTRIYMSLLFVGFSSLLLGITVGVSMVGKPVSPLIIVAMCGILAFTVWSNADHLKEQLEDE